MKHAIRSIFSMIPDAIENGSMIAKSSWLKAVSGSARVQTVLNSEVVCGFDVIRPLRQPQLYRTELVNLRTEHDGYVTADDLLLLGQELAQLPKFRSMQSSKDVFKCAMKLPRHTHRGRYVLVSLHDKRLLRIHDIYGSPRTVWEACLKPVVADSIARSSTANEKRAELREYIIVENIVPQDKIVL